MGYLVIRGDPSRLVVLKRFQISLAVRRRRPGISVGDAIE
jgi:hypothetical protein